MKSNRFKGILEKHILPMYTGATLTEETFPEQKFVKRLAYLENASNIIIRLSEDADYQFRLNRSQAFEQEDASFIQSFVAALQELKPLWEKPLLHDLITPTLRRLVSRKVAPRQCEEFVVGILAQFEAWAEQTYEGRRISAAVGIDTNMALVGGGVSLLEMYAESFGAVLANGLESFLIAGLDGNVSEYKPMSASDGSAASLKAPLRFSQLAEWSKDGNIGIGLNRHGEILIFKNSGLVFAKRRGTWHFFAHEAVAKRMALKKAFSREVRSAVYQSCLDVSFARTGGCIAMVQRTQVRSLQSEKIVGEQDLLASGSSELKIRCLQAIIAGRPFQELDRRLRQDILAMDGATILDYEGKLLAAGAIVKVNAGSSGGGRLAAAKALSKWGLAVKVSSDGAITGFTKGEKLFSVG